MMLSLCIIAAIVLSTSSLCWAAPGETSIERHDGSKPTTYPTLTDALAKAQDGDVLELQGGEASNLATLQITKSIMLLGSKDSSTPTTLSMGEGQEWMTISSSVSVLSLSNIIFKGITSPLDATNTHLTIRDCHFTSEGKTIITKDDSSAVGGGGPNLFIYSSHFNGGPFQKTKKAEGGGGLIKISQTNSNIIISTSSFTNGHSTQGGGIYIKTTGRYKANLSITSTHFTSCVAQEEGGGIYIDALNSNTDSTIHLHDITIQKSRAITMGGGIYIANTPASNGIIKMTAADVIGNIAIRGGGIYISPSATAFTLSSRDGMITFKGNQAVEKGGGLYIGASTVFRNFNYANILFKDNSAGIFSSWTILSSLAINSPPLTNAFTLGISAASPSPNLRTLAKGGGIYIQGFPSSPVGENRVLLTFPMEKPWSPRHSGNIADQGGLIYSEARSTGIIGLLTKGNFARSDGGAICLERDAVISHSKLVGDISDGGSGGAIFSSDNLRIQDTLIQSAKAAITGGGISLVGRTSVVQINRSQIVKCHAGAYGHAIHFAQPTTGSLGLDTCLIYGHGLRSDESDNIMSSAIVLEFEHPTTKGSYSGTFHSSENQYQKNLHGHVTIVSSGHIMKWEGHPFNFQSTQDYYDDTPTKHSSNAINFINSNVFKQYSGDFFEGSCPTEWGKASNVVIVETCTGQSVRRENKGGYYSGKPLPEMPTNYLLTVSPCEEYTPIEDAGTCMPLPAEIFPKPELRAYGRDIIGPSSSS